MFDSRNKQQIDEKLLRKINRQLKAVKLWLGFFGIIMIIGFAGIGYFVFQAVQIINDTKQAVTDIQEQASDIVDVKGSVCENRIFANSDFCSDQKTE